MSHPLPGPVRTLRHKVRKFAEEPAVPRDTKALIG